MGWKEKWGIGWEEVSLLTLVLVAIALELVPKDAGWLTRAHDHLVDLLLIGIAAYIVEGLGVKVHKLNSSVEKFKSSLEKLNSSVGGVARDIKTFSTDDFPPMVKLLVDSAKARGILVASTPQERRKQYATAEKVLKSQTCARIFLMQRSSTLLLGPDRDWAEEENFREALLERIKHRGTIFFPVIDLAGIKRHHGETKFTNKEEAIRALKKDKEGYVYFPAADRNWSYLKQPRGSSADAQSAKQARILLIEEQERDMRDMLDGFVVMELGGKQFSFHLRGPELHQCMEACETFYKEDCDLVSVEKLRDDAGLGTLTDGIELAP